MILKPYFFLLLFILFGSNITYSQNKKQSINLPLLTFENQTLVSILDSIILFEKKCVYYNDSLPFCLTIEESNEINCVNNKNEIDTTIQIESFNEIGAALRIHPIGYFKFLSHLVFVYGKMHDILFTKSSQFKSFYYKTTKLRITDDSFTQCVFKYSNGKLTLVHRYTYCE